MLPFADFMGLGGQGYSINLRCFSAPFFPKYDTKINELNYGGRVCTYSLNPIQLLIASLDFVAKLDA
jgi:hypothetical protein